MKIIDLTPSYLECKQENNYDSYLKSYPDFFKHFFKYWGDRSLPFSILDFEEIQSLKNRVIKSIRKSKIF